MSFIRVIRKSAQIRDSDKWGNRKAEVGRRKSEIGNRKSEVGNRKRSIRQECFCALKISRSLRLCVKCHSSVSSVHPCKSVILTKSEIGNRKRSIRQEFLCALKISRSLRPDDTVWIRTARRARGPGLCVKCNVIHPCHPEIRANP